MYTIPPLQEKINTEPWIRPLSERVFELARDIRDGYSTALQIYRRADTSTFRYLCYNPYQYTKASKRWKCHYFYSYEYETILNYIDKVQLIVLCRLKWTVHIQEIIDKARELNKPVLCQIDDMVYSLADLYAVTSTIHVFEDNDSFYDTWFSEFGRVQLAAQQADGYITTNNFLGQKISKTFHKPYAVVHNALNAEQLAVSQRYLDMKKKICSQKPFLIGYFSGSPSHVNDFRSIATEIHALLKAHEDINLLVVGFMDFPDYMQGFIKAGRIQFRPLVDFLKLQRLIAEVDVNIVPLIDNEFTNCKSELKFFEAGVVGTITCATPTYTYTRAIRSGINGFLCQQGDWYRTLENIYLGRVSKDIVCNAIADAYKNYTGKQILAEIENALDDFTR